MLGGAQVADSALEAVDGADAVVLVTEWPEFGELDWDEVKARMRDAARGSTAATSSTARRCARRASPTRGSGGR